MRYKSASIGEVPEHWNVAPLRDFIDLITYGFTNPMPDAEDGPWKVTAKDVVGGRIQYSTARRTTAHAFATLLTDKSRPKIGDVLLTKDGSIGRIAVVDRDNICINQSVALLRPNQRILPRYLAFLLRSPFYQARMEGDSDGSTIKHIYITRVDKMEVAVPPVYEQVEHLSLLGTIDDRIDLLRETNATLEAIAQALFKSWFVDFDPVRAKAEDRDPEGVLPEVADLFPSEFEDSELGGIPKGWRTKSVYDLAEYVNGAAYKAFSPNTERRGLPIIKIAELKAGVTSQTAHSDKEMPEKYRIQAGDILFSWSGNPETSIDTFVWPHSAGWLNQHIFRVIVNDAQERVFVLQVLRHLRPVFAGIARNKQTTGLGHVTIADMKRLLVAIPDRAVLGLFVDQVAPIQRRVFENEQQALNLTELRDTLLPRLMSGKLHIPEIQETVRVVAA